MKKFFLFIYFIISLNLSAQTVYSGCQGKTVTLGDPYNSVWRKWSTGETTKTITKTLNDSGLFKFWFRYTINKVDTLSDTIFLRVYPIPQITFKPIPDLCQNSSLLNLHEYAYPQGGTWTVRDPNKSNAMNQNILDPTLLDTGITVLTYIYESSFGCFATKNTKIKIISCTSGIQPEKQGCGLDINVFTEYITIKNRLLMLNRPHLYIYDLSGKILIHRTLNINPAQSEKIDLSILKEGIYLLQINNSKEILTRKFLISCH